MFALALWDSRRRRLLLARDRFGIKPSTTGSPIGSSPSSSELKALLRQPGFARPRPGCPGGVLAFNSIPAPLTIFEQARKLPPATF